MPVQPADRSNTGMYGGCAIALCDKLILSTIKNGSKKNTISHA